MPCVKHTKPCRDCPWRRNAVPGWLGSSVDAEQDFVANALADVSDEPLPCHSTINYDDPDWKASQYPDAALCAGALIFARNTAKLPRDPAKADAVLSVQADHDRVFSSAEQFLDHHRGADALTRALERAQAEAASYPCAGCGGAEWDADELIAGACPGCGAALASVHDDGYVEPPALTCEDGCGPWLAEELVAGACPGCGAAIAGAVAI